MNHTPGATAGNGGTFGPEQAAALLDQTTQQARREFQPSPPWLLVTRAAMVLAALGAIWLSVRGQHPYRGPTAADIPILVAFIVVNFAATAGVTFATYPTSVLVIPGLARTALMAARSNWRGLATGLAIVVIGIVGAFAGPAGSWAVAGVGLCAVLLGNAAAIAWLQGA